MKNGIWKKAVSIAGGIAILTGVVTGAFAIDKRYAKSYYVQLVEMRLDNKIIQDNIDALQKRIWMLEDRFAKTEDPAIKMEIEHLRNEIKKLEAQLGK